MKRGERMATRHSVEEFLQRCEDVIRFAKEQYTEGKKTETITETKTTSITWKLNSIGKAVTEPASTGSVEP